MVEQSQQIERKKTRKVLLLVLVSVAAIGLCWMLASAVILNFHDNLQDSGLYGDSFGPVTSLFSALAFAGIIATFIVQYQDLVIQRQDIARSRQAHEEIARLQSMATESMLIAELSRISSNETAENPLSKVERDYAHKLEAMLNNLNRKRES